MPFEGWGGGKDGGAGGGREGLRRRPSGRRVIRGRGAVEERGGEAVTREEGKRVERARVDVEEVDRARLLLDVPNHDPTLLLLTTLRSGFLSKGLKPRHEDLVSCFRR